MKKQHCIHKGFWDIYQAINFHMSFCEEKGQLYRCSACGTTCILTRTGCKQLKTFSLKTYLTYMLWMLPAVVFIVLFVYGLLSAFAVVLLTLIYHFSAMRYIITYSKKLHITKK